MRIRAHTVLHSTENHCREVVVKNGGGGRRDVWFLTLCVALLGASRKKPIRVLVVLWLCSSWLVVVPPPAPAFSAPSPAAPRSGAASTTLRYGRPR